MAFLDDLRRYGPDSTHETGPDEARAYCARLTREHYENFSVVTWLTPRALRPAMQAIYSYCRWADDLGDEVGDRQRSRELLAWWGGELDAMYEGRARHPVFVALREVVGEYGIPVQPFGALVSAFEQDQEVTEYETYSQLIDYCTRSANPVGHLVLYLARAWTPENARLSDAICTALQLANFWQDVARDLELGRIYLPREDQERHGVAREDLLARRFSEAFRGLMVDLVDRARGLFREGEPLVAHVPRGVAVDVELFSRGGMAILDRIERQSYDVLSRRPSLSKATKAGLIGRALLGRLGFTTGRRPRRVTGALAGGER
jgi:squalene synthase HpnC